MAKDWNAARLIFVCSGNICRSPMAAGLAKAAFERRGYSPLIISMGTIGLTGQGADERAVEVMAEIGLDISDHRAQRLNNTLLNVADYAFGMTRTHLEHMRAAGPNAFRSGRLLAKFADPPLESIPDPVHGTLDDFRACRDLMATCIESWCSKVVDQG